jgi:hypothetical protein
MARRGRQVWYEDLFSNGEVRLHPGFGISIAAKLKSEARALRGTPRLKIRLTPEVRPHMSLPLLPGRMGTRTQRSESYC